MSTPAGPVRDDSVQVSLGRLREIEEQRIAEEQAEQQRREKQQQRALLARREAEARAAREAEERRARERAEEQRREEEQRRREQREERLRREELRQHALVEAELRLERARLAAAGVTPAGAARQRWLLVAGLLLVGGLVAFLAQGWSGAATRAHQRRLELIAISGRHDAKLTELRHARDALRAAQQRESTLQRSVDGLRHELLAARQRPAVAKRRRRPARGAGKPRRTTPPVIHTSCSNSDDPIDCIKTRGL